VLIAVLVALGFLSQVADAKFGTPARWLVYMAAITLCVGYLRSRR
jgi:hypothetical protein